MVKKVGDKSKAEIIREALSATKTLTKPDNKKVMQWIDKNYSDFKWGKQPSSEVSIARSNELKRQGKKPKKRAAKTVTRKSSTASANSMIADVKKVAQLAKEMGGVEKLQEAMELLVEIKEIG